MYVCDIMLSEEYYEDIINEKYEGVIAIDKPVPLGFNEAGYCLLKYE